MSNPGPLGSKMGGRRPRSVLISGASGLIGRRLVLELRASGHLVSCLVRRKAEAPGEIEWDPASGRLEFRPGSEFDVVINLAGENVGTGRWTAPRKVAILNSRIGTTRTLVGALQRLPRPPEALVSASAVGFYGDGRDRWLDESSQSGDGFLAEVCRRWEMEAHVAEQGGVRLVLLRTGMVLAPRGGALGKMLPIFSLGLGGRLGNGRQWMSWIAIDDLVRIVCRASFDNQINGPINAVAPQPVTNAEFTRALGRVLHRPAIFPVPAFLLRLIFGQMADEAILASCRVRPSRLQSMNFKFCYPEILPALHAVLGR